MTREEKIQWMAVWAAKNGLKLDLQGECGFGRECVGVSTEGHYPDYKWYDDDWNRVDNNGDVWTPKNSYHKHPCVAVLGRDEEAESQLYDWLKWFDDNGFKLETGNQPVDPTFGQLAILMGKHRYARMVRSNYGICDEKMTNALELAKALAEKARHKQRTVNVSKKFIGDFNKVAAHYRCDSDEIKIMKECVRRDQEDAETCFDSLAKEIE